MKVFLHIFWVFAGLFWACQAQDSSVKRVNGKDPSSLFQTYCVNCHGRDGSLKINGAKDLRYSQLSLEERILVISEGRNVMTAFKSVLNNDQIRALAIYTQGLNQMPKDGQ